MPNNVSFGVQAKGVSKASSDLDRLRDKFDKVQKQGAKGFAIGAAAGATTFALSAMSQAVSQVTDVIGDSIQAARDDEVSIQKLGTALRANIPAWDGNTDAIEKTLAARMKLGFSDDEQRDSLAKLVVATHDVNKALEVQRTAMDLARLKGISLAEAGDALTKVEAGQFRALKALGIQLKAGATATDALRAVQKAATGQAEDYAKTNEGKMLVAQTKVNEAMERFGYTIMPAVSDAMAGGADAIVGFTTVLDTFQHGIAKTTDAQLEQVQGASDLLGALGALFPAYGMLSDAIDGQVAASQAAIDANGRMGISSGKAADDMVGAADDVGGAFGDMENAAEDWRDKYRDVSGETIRRANRVRDAFVNTTQDIIDDAFEPLETRAELHDIRMGLFEQEKAKKTRDSADDIIASLHDEATALNKLGSTGDLTADDVERFTKDARKNYDRMSKEARADIDAIIARLRFLAGMPNIKKTVEVGYKGHAPGTGPLRAAGGPVSANQPYTVGERGPETFVPNANGTIIPNGKGMGGGSSVTFNVTVNAGAGSGLSAADGRRLAADIGPAIYADMQRRGYLPRTATGLTG